MLLQSLVPETAADLIATLPHLHRDQFSRHAAAPHIRRTSAQLLAQLSCSDASLSSQVHRGNAMSATTGTYIGWHWGAHGSQALAGEKSMCTRYRMTVLGTASALHSAERTRSARTLSKHLLTQPPVQIAGVARYCCVQQTRQSIRLLKHSRPQGSR